MELPDHARRWNQLAEKHGLRHAGGFRAKARAEQVDYYQTMTEDFWKDLDAALGRRGPWAQERRFPNFDQVMDETIACRLFEGYYEDEVTPQAEREALIREILVRRLRLPSGAVVTSDGIEGGAGLESWNEISTERLRRMGGHARAGT